MPVLPSRTSPIALQASIIRGGLASLRGTLCTARYERPEPGRLNGQACPRQRLRKLQAERNAQRALLAEHSAHFLQSTARSPKVRLESMAVAKPVQLKDSSAAEAAATPSMMGTRQASAGAGVDWPGEEEGRGRGSGWADLAPGSSDRDSRGSPAAGRGH